MINLGRNLDWDKNVDKTLWKDLQDHEITKKHKFRALDLSMMAMALGFIYKCPKPFVKGPIGSGGNILGENNIKKQKAVAFIMSLAVYHEGSLSVLEGNEKKIRRIAEEYANGGVVHLHKIFMDSKSDIITIQKLVKLMKNS